MALRYAFIYARQSSGKEEESESIEMQIAHCRELASKEGLKVLGIFQDANCSGRLYPSGCEELAAMDSAFCNWLLHHTTDKRSRPGFGALLSRLSEVDFLLVDDLTRVARPVDGSFLQSLIKQRLCAAKVKIWTVKGGVVDYGSFADRLMSDLQSNINDNQINIQSQKSKDALDKLRDSGILPTAPRMFGVRYLGSKRVEVIPECVEAIRMMYRKVLEYQSYTSIIAEVNAKYPHLFKKACYTSTFRHILTQPFYAGYMRDTQGVLIPAAQMQGKEIIPYEQWRRAQRIIEDKRTWQARPHGRSHPFSGILVCGNCQARLVTQMEDDHEVYLCRAGTYCRRDPKCRQARTNVTLQQYAPEWTGLREALAPLLILAQFQRLKEQRALEGRRAELGRMEADYARRKAKLNRLIDSFMDDAVPEGFFRTSLQRQVERLRQAHAAIEELKRASQMPDADDALSRYWGRFEELIAPELPDSVYAAHLHAAVRQVTCWREAVQVETVFGTFYLNRNCVGRTRNFPRFRWREVPLSSGDGETTHLRNFEITYLYDKDAPTILLADFGVMRILAQQHPEKYHQRHIP